MTLFRRLASLRAVSCRLVPFALVAAIGATALPALAPAQDYDRPPRGYDDPNATDDTPMRDRVDTPDAGSVAIRMSKAENRIREMTGQIEELQNANRRLVEQLQKFQTDVESRLSAGPQKRSEMVPKPATPTDTAAASTTTPSSAADATRRKRHDEAFDPASAGADAPGRPKPLGSAGSAQPDDAIGKPMDLSGNRLNRGASDDTLAPALHPATPGARSAATTNEKGTIIANTEPGAAPTGTAASGTLTSGTAAPATPRGEYDAALASYRDKQFDVAEKGFSAFIQKNPKSRLAADATYYLGESYAQRGRSREAAEQYLKVSTDYATSSRAPDAMLHLGMSLRQLGAKEQACATFTEIGRKYPNAPAYVKSGAEREAKRSQC